MPNVTPKQRKQSFDHSYYPINITRSPPKSPQTMSPPNKVEKSGSQDFGHRKGSGSMFSGLQQYKREDGSASQARRESIKDMQPKSGFVANLWNNTFKGGNADQK